MAGELSDKSTRQTAQLKINPCWMFSSGRGLLWAGSAWNPVRLPIFIGELFYTFHSAIVRLFLNRSGGLSKLTVFSDEKKLSAGTVPADNF